MKLKNYERLMKVLGLNPEEEIAEKTLDDLKGDLSIKKKKKISR